MTSELITHPVAIHLMQIYPNHLIDTWNGRVRLVGTVWSEVTASGWTGIKLMSRDMSDSPAKMAPKSFILKADLPPPQVGITLVTL